MVRYKRSFFLIIGILWAFRLTAIAEQPPLTSQHVSSIFIRQAIEISRQDPLDPAGIERAMTFLNAALALDSSSETIAEQMLRTAAANCYSSRDYTDSLRWALDRYLNGQADLELAAGALRCMLERLNTRAERETLLDKLYRKYASQNSFFASDIAAQLGLLAAEKADAAAAMNYAAAAYEMNRCNQLAFETMVDLSGLQNLSPTPSVQLLYARAMLDLNPYDLNAAVRYADALRRFQLYDAASQAYGYAAQLFEFLYPNKPLDEGLLGNWLLSLCHVEQMEMRCLEIANKYRDAQRFNLMLEAAAGKALAGLGQAEKAQQILEEAGRKAESLLAAEGLALPIYPEHLAWFYSFVLEQPDKALAWSNRAFEEAPQRQGVGAMFAYALAVNGQYELAAQYAQPLRQTDQIAALTMALVELASDQKQAALESLRTAVEMAPGTFAADKAIRLVKDQGSDYIPSINIEAIQKDLEQQYSKRIVPVFIAPADHYSLRLLFNGSDFYYGVEISPRLVIENTGTDPLIIADGSCLSGVIRIDAVLKGDLNAEIPNLLTMKFRPSSPIQPKSYVSVPLDLNTGKLRKLLAAYPQADVEIHFTAYLDPILSSDGRVECRLAGLNPVRAVIQRPGVVLSRDFLIQRLDALSKGRPGQKLQAASLFAGLLAEQRAFELSQADFRHIQTERVLLVDAVRRSLADEDWKVRIQTMAALLDGSVPMEYGLVREISANLHHELWPVRFMAMYLLAQAQPGTFQKVIDWAAQYDTYPLNRRLAAAMGADAKPQNQTDPNSL